MDSICLVNSSEEILALHFLLNFLQENSTWPLLGMLFHALKHDIYSHAWTSVAAHFAVHGLKKNQSMLSDIFLGQPGGEQEGKWQQDGEC